MGGLYVGKQGAGFGKFALEVRPLGTRQPAAEGALRRVHLDAEFDDRRIALKLADLPPPLAMGIFGLKDCDVLRQETNGLAMSRLGLGLQEDGTDGQSDR
jgi:hypothetical protein